MMIDDASKQGGHISKKPKSGLHFIPATPKCSEKRIGVCDITREYGSRLAYGIVHYMFRDGAMYPVDIEALVEIWSE
jgi:hypothetical protein